MKWTAEYFVSLLVREILGRGWGEVHSYSELVVGFLKHFISYEKVADGAEVLRRMVKR